jgi:hypothetical protein
MNKKAKRDRRGAKAEKLSFKRETIRSMSEAESKRVAGGRICVGSCQAPTCPRSVCTITVDTTL